MKHEEGMKEGKIQKRKRKGKETREINEGRKEGSGKED